MINSVAELELIRGQQQSFHVGNNESYWVGGSTYESGNIEFSDYEPYPEAILIVITEETSFLVPNASPKSIAFNLLIDTKSGVKSPATCTPQCKF